MAQVLWEFEEEHRITENLPIGFTFSFPVQQTGLISGTLIEWTKGFTAAGAVGQDVTEMLEAALKRKGVSFSKARVGVSWEEECDVNVACANFHVNVQVRISRNSKLHGGT